MLNRPDKAITMDSLHVFPTPTAQTAPHQGPPKLRSSCDACGETKVKCDRAQPECSRCVEAGVPCVYGPSRNRGKPPRKRVGGGHDNPKVTQKRAKHSQTTPGVRDDAAVGPASSLSTGCSPAPANGIEPGGVLDAMGPANADGHLLSSTICPELPLDDWGYLWNLDASLDISPPVGKPRDDFGQHSCSRESYEIFRDLICPSPSLHAPESNSTVVSAQLDEVLLFNRIAVDRLARVLKCPCAKSGHRAVVHASIVSRILIWYQQAAGWPSNNKAEHETATSSAACPSQQGYRDRVVDVVPGTSETSRPLVRNTGFVVELPPIMVGTFKLENQGLNDAFRTQVVLSELKKMSVLIDSFTSEDARDTLADGLYANLGKWLQAEHSRTAKILGAKLAEEMENIDT